MEKYDVVIIGSGLGGLECAYILSKKGLNVCVVEQHFQIGGCLQTFRRGENVFDTGFHYVGGLDEGQSLNTLFRYFELMDLPWRKLDEDCFDEIIYNDDSYAFANGYDRFVDTLAASFPKERVNLEKYASLLEEVGGNLFRSFDKKKEEDFYSASIFSKSAYQFLNETISDPHLRNVISGASLKMELHPQKLPLYIFAQINDSFIRSAWRLEGGGSLIAETLASKVKAMGGTILIRSKVTGLIEEDGKISVAEVNDGERKITADYFISNIHPARTLDLVSESKLLRKIYRKRISGLPNTYGMFTVNVALKDGIIPYLNRNQYIYSTNDVWSYHQYSGTNDVTAVLVSYRIPENGEKFARNLDILTPMHWEEVNQWENTSIGRRGEAYELLKADKAGKCIKLASRYIPELEKAIDRVYTSTPLSYRDYTGTADGSAYGIRKDYSQLMYTILTPRTPVPNLLLTGQNLNLHGILGVSMTSFFTCAEIIGMDTVLKELNIR
jgi:all-trans-retinol 13,14-reductase